MRKDGTSKLNNSTIDIREETKCTDPNCLICEFMNLVINGGMSGDPIVYSENPIMILKPIVTDDTPRLPS